MTIIFGRFILAFEKKNILQPVTTMLSSIDRNVNSTFVWWILGLLLSTNNNANF